jgi:CDP-4-dehydro-6-deoxyglucose reductase, E1
MIKLADNIIEKQDVDTLCDWLKKTNHYTKGEKTLDFEREWSEWQGCKYSIFVNSGSSANLLVIAGLLYSNRLKNKKIILPAVSWVTTVSPSIMLGLEPILCDSDPNDLGLSTSDFENLCIEHNPSAVMLVHVLGHSNNMKEITRICKKYNVLLIEDTCEAYGSIYSGEKLGNFGLASTFSYFYGHQMATVEGGMVCTNDYELYNTMVSIRSHGWLRDNDENFKKRFFNKYNMHDEFNLKYFFVYPGLNVRNTDINAVIGLSQIKRIDKYISSRNKNYNLYCSILDGNVWTQKSNTGLVSSLSFGVMDKNKKKITDALIKNHIECRPLICGSIQEQPFWHERYKPRNLPNAKIVHEFGFYVPCHQNLTEDQIRFICKIILDNKGGL